MGWMLGKLPDGREVGYGVPAVCEAEGCAVEIDRGLAYLCGEMHGQDDDACGRYFCVDHLVYMGHGQRCDACADAIDAALPPCTCETVADERVCTRTDCPDWVAP